MNDQKNIIKWPNERARDLPKDGKTHLEGFWKLLADLIGMISYVLFSWETTSY